MTEKVGAMPEKYDGFGFASFVTSLIASAGVFFFYAVSAYVHLASGGKMDESAYGAMVVEFFSILFSIMLLVSVGLGVAGLSFEDRNKRFSLFGIIFGSFVFLVAFKTLFG